MATNDPSGQVTVSRLMVVSRVTVPPPGRSAGVVVGMIEPSTWVRVPVSVK
jgi:hypothetical protein